jgi:hypothetical protein
MDNEDEVCAATLLDGTAVHSFALGIIRQETISRISTTKLYFFVGLPENDRAFLAGPRNLESQSGSEVDQSIHHVDSSYGVLSLKGPDICYLPLFALAWSLLANDIPFLKARQPIRSVVECAIP